MRWPSDFPGNHPRAEVDHSFMRWLVDLMEDATMHGWWATLRKRLS